MPNSTVAICIPTYNQSAYLSAAVRSACAQTHPAEVWVGDDCSTDDTPRVLAELEREFPQLRVNVQPHNLGITLNNNALLRLPQTEFIARLDSDDLMAPRLCWACCKSIPVRLTRTAPVQEIGGARRSAPGSSSGWAQ